MEIRTVVNLAQIFLLWVCKPWQVATHKLAPLNGDNLCIYLRQKDRVDRLSYAMNLQCMLWTCTQIRPIQWQIHVRFFHQGLRVNTTLGLKNISVKTNINQPLF